MNFQYPEFLYALAAIAIPIIIHLFNFRRYKKVYFSSIRFLKDVEETTKAQSQIKQLLVLLSRILAITFLVLAFAQPYIPNESGLSENEKKTISIYLDNSFSMQTSNTDGNRFEIARQYAYEIVKSFEPSARFQILSNAFSGKQQRFYSREDALELIDQIEIRPEVRKVSEVIQRQKALLEQSKTPQKRCYLISDFQKNILDIEQNAVDTFASIYFVPILGESQENQFIDSVWITSPSRQVNNPIEIAIKINNTSDQKLDNGNISLSLNGAQKASGNYTILPHQALDTNIQFSIQSPGVQHGIVSIGNDGMNYDNQYFFSFNVREKINITEIRGANANDKIEYAYSKDPIFNYQVQKASNVDPSTLNQAEVIVLNQPENINSGLSVSILDLVRKGASVIFIPSIKGNLQSYNDWLSKASADLFTGVDTSSVNSGKINLNHQLLKSIFQKTPKNVEFPTIKSKFLINSSSQSKRENILSGGNNVPLITQYTLGKGTLNVFSFSLSEKSSNFTKHSLFLPYFYMVAFQAEEASPLSYTIGKDNFVAVNDIQLKPDSPVHVVSTDQSIDVIPGIEKTGRNIFLSLNEQISEAGHYNLILDKSNIGGLSFNYNRTESNITIPSLDELKNKIQSSGIKNIQVVEGDYSTISNSIQNLNKGINYWKWCLIIVLVFIGIEIILLRFLK